MDEDPLPYHVVTLGKSPACRWSLMRRLAKDQYDDGRELPKGAVFSERRLLQDGGRRALMFLWGLDFSETSQHTQVQMSTRAALIAYDIADASSFEAVPMYVEAILHETPLPNVPIFIVGCILDELKERQVKPDDGYELARKYKCSFFEVSTKTGDFCEELVHAVGQSAHDYDQWYTNRYLKKKRKCAVQ